MRKARNSRIQRVLSGILALVLIISLLPLPNGVVRLVSAATGKDVTVNLVDSNTQKIDALNGKTMTLTFQDDQSTREADIKEGCAMFEGVEIGTHTVSISDALGYEYTTSVEVTEETESVDVCVTALQSAVVSIKINAEDMSNQAENVTVTYVGYTSGTAVYQSETNCFTFEAYVGKEYTIAAAPKDTAKYATVRKTLAVTEDVQVELTLRQKIAVSLTADKNSTITAVSNGAPVEGYVLKGDPVTVTVTAMDGYRIKKVKVGDTEQAEAVGKKTYNFTVNSVESQLTVSAEVSKAYANVSIAETTGGSVSVVDADRWTQGIQVAADTDFEIKVTPENGKELASLKVDGVDVTNQVKNGVYTCSGKGAGATVNVAATFKTIWYTISVGEYEHGSATIVYSYRDDNNQKVSKEEKLCGGQISLPYGASLTFTVEADTGYRISDLVITNTTNNDQAQTSQYIGEKKYEVSVSRLDCGYAVELAFAPRTYVVDFEYDDARGTVSYEDGEEKVVGGKVEFYEATDANGATTVKIKAKAESGNRISQVTITFDNEVVVNKSYQKNDDDEFEYELKLDDAWDNCNFQVTFADERYYSVSVGTTIDDGAQETVQLQTGIAYGDEAQDIVFDAMEKCGEGYEIKSLTVNGEQINEAAGKASYTWQGQPMTADCLIEVVYGLKEYKVTVNVEGETAGVTVSKGTVVKHGFDYDLTINLAEGAMQRVKVEMNGEDVTDQLVDIDGGVKLTIKVVEDVDIEVSLSVLTGTKLQPDQYLKYTKHEFELPEPHVVSIEKNRMYIVVAPDAEVKLAAKDQDVWVAYNGNWSKQSQSIKKDVKIETIQVWYGGSNDKNETFLVDIQVIFDSTIPTIQELKASPDNWTKESVTVTGKAQDLPGKNQAKAIGVDYVVWSTTRLSKTDVLASENRLTVNEDGTFTHTLEEPQNTTYYYYAVDKAGNVGEDQTANVKIDKVAPVIVAENWKFQIKENNEFEDFINLITFGLVCNEEIYVTVQAEEPADSVASGVNTITLFINETSYETKTVDENNTADFELREKDFGEGAYIYAQATDKAGNTGNMVMYEQKIQITSAKPVVTPETGEAVYVDENGNKWYDGDVDVMLTIKEEVENADEASDESNSTPAGLKEETLKVYINGVLVIDGAASNGESEEETTEEPVEKEPVYTMEVMVNTGLLPEINRPEDGKYEITVYIENNAGTANAAEPVETVYIDREKPEITGFDFKLVETSAAEKVLRFLTFGIFANDQVEVAVSAKDAENAPSAGLKEITLYTADAVDGEKTEFATTSAKDGTATFKVPAEVVDDAVCLEAYLSACVADNVNHVSETVAPNSENSNAQGSYIMVETVKPAITIAYDDPTAQINDLTDKDGQKWYAEDVTFNVAVMDNDSGVYNVQIAINDTVVLDETYAENRTMEKSYAVSTGAEGVARNEDGSYHLAVTVTDNAGNVYEDGTTVVYKDIDAPTVEKFTFTPAEGGDGQSDEDLVTSTTYGFYFPVDTTVTIYTADAAPTNGVNKVTYRLVDYRGNLVRSGDLQVDAEGTCNLTVNGGFKGQIYAYATDNVGNYPYTVTDEVKVPTEVHPDGVVVETQEQQDSEEHIFFTKAEAPYTTSAGGGLYAADVPVTVLVQDSFSGIEFIEWSVEAPYDRTRNMSGKLTVTNEGALVVEGSGMSWSITDLKENEKDNLVYQVHGALTVSNDSNNIVVRVKVTDRAGYMDEQSITFSIDKTAPTIQVVYDNNTPDEQYTNYYNADRTMTITVTERNFSAADFLCLITNGNEHPDSQIPKLVGWTENWNREDPNRSTYTATVKYTADGDYETDLSFKDLAGNAAVEKPEKQVFTIDQTLPMVSVSYRDAAAVSNGYYYSGQRVAVITIVEHNFDDSRVEITGTAVNDGTAVTFPSHTRWTSSGNTHTATITYSADAEYVFDIAFRDMAGNASADYAGDKFVVDNQDPEITISGVEHLSANNGVIAPVIEYSDTNFNRDTVSIELVGVNNGQVYYSGSYSDLKNGQRFAYDNFDMDDQQVDDIYMLTVTVTDLSGRTSTQSITFSANRHGSTYDLTQLESVNGKYVQSEIDLVFYEINVDELLNETIKIRLTHNGSTRELVKGTDYTYEAVSGSTEQWYRYEYRIKAELFAADGTYSVAVYSVDRADNINENIDEKKQADITFGVDKTEPIINVADLESNEQYNEAVKTVTLEIRDNMLLQSVVIELNGEPVEFTVDGDLYTFQIPESKQTQSVKIVATDASGRQLVTEIDGITVSTNLLILWFRNTPLFIGTLAGTGAIGLGIFFLILFKKKKKEEEEGAAKQ